MSIIRAGTTTTTALTSIGNTDGTLQLQVNGTTPSVTLNALGAVGVGAVPNFGTSGQALVSSGSTAAPTWANVTTSPAGTTGQVQYNSGGAFAGSANFTFDGTNTTVAGNVTGATLRTTRASGSQPEVVLTQTGVASWSVYNPPSSTDLRFYNGADRLSLNGNGAIGVGSSPSYGTSGQVLTSQGSGAAPAWATPAGGSWVFLTSVTANNSATVDITDGISTTYKQYALVVSNFRPVNSGISLLLRQRTGGTYQTTGYNYFLDRSNSGSGALSSRSTSGDAIYILENQNGSAQNTGVVIYLNNPAYTPASPNTTAHMVYWVGASSGGNICVAQGAGGLPNETSAVTGYRFLTSNGNIATGTFSLYGIANS